MAHDIVWGKSLESALMLARQENKLVLTSFFSPACEACIKMKKCTLITESVQEYITKYFIPLKYESGIDSEQFMRFGVTAKPAVLVLDAEGNEIFRKIGYFDPEKFIEKLEKARKKAAHIAAGRHG
ncbi:MAG: thioredoxin fold domain-containing protein [Nitrospirae bacterium]|nr:thioredoxin fold domain-containing protein [Nitrospirota bacterium]